MPLLSLNMLRGREVSPSARAPGVAKGTEAREAEEGVEATKGSKTPRATT